MLHSGNRHWVFVTDTCMWSCRVTGGELFDDIVAREFYSEKDAR